MRRILGRISTGREWPRSMVPQACGISVFDSIAYGRAGSPSSTPSRNVVLDLRLRLHPATSCGISVFDSIPQRRAGSPSSTPSRNVVRDLRLRLRQFEDNMGALNVTFEEDELPSRKSAGSASLTPTDQPHDPAGGECGAVL